MLIDSREQHSYCSKHLIESTTKIKWDIVVVQVAVLKVLEIENIIKLLVLDKERVRKRKITLLTPANCSDLLPMPAIAPMNRMKMRQ